MRLEEFPRGDNLDERRTRGPVDGNIVSAADLAPAQRKVATRGSPQAWVRAYLWNKRARQRGRVFNVLIDSGAGGGNYASAKFIHEIEHAEYNSRSMISKKGRGRLRAANPESSKEPPMSILGTCFLSLVFPPVDGVFYGESAGRGPVATWSHLGHRVLAALWVMGAH